MGFLMNTLALPSGVAVHSGVPAKLSLYSPGFLLLSCPALSLPPRLPGSLARIEENSPTFASQFNPAFQSCSYPNLLIPKPSLPTSLRVLSPYLGKRQA